MLVSSVMMLVAGHSDFLNNLRMVLKLSLPFYLFPFLRIYINNKTELHGILTTFLYSCIIAWGILLYEIVAGPLGVQISRGLTRYQGGFGDVMNYAIYINIGAYLVGYYQLKSSGKSITIAHLLVLLSFCIIALLKIRHVTSYFVFIAVTGLYLLFALKARPAYFIILVLFVGLFYFFMFDRLYEENVDPLIKYELQVLEGNRDTRYLMHGRLGRWENMWDNFREQPLPGKLFGTFITSKSYYLIAGGVHNDLLRILFFTGYFGFALYLAFLYKISRKLKFLDIGDKFLLLGSFMVLLLFSVTTLPTMYAPFMYPVLSIFAYFSQADDDIMEDYELEQGDQTS